MTALYNEGQSVHLSRFFKTGKGEYGEGDRFLGIKVPVTRSIVKNFRKSVVLDDVETLIASEWHEIRLAGFLLLVELYKEAIKAADTQRAQSIVDFYLNHIHWGNNWDLVDLVAPYILGDWVLRNPGKEYILFELSSRQGFLWHQRVAIVASFPLIKAGNFGTTLRIAEAFLTHHHDLIHKASGWMLREVGKRGGKNELVGFLNRHIANMPRTMLRYAIERFPEIERKQFMSK